MPAASRPLPYAALYVATGVLAAIGLAIPGTASPAVASAAPLAPHGAPVKWLAEKGPVPGASTHTAPALATVTLYPDASELLLFWTGPRAGTAGFRISYQTSLSLGKNVWTSPGLVDGGKAITSSRPGAAPIGTGASRLVIVVWKDIGSSRVLYSIGTAGNGIALEWNGIVPIPGASTSAAPAVYRPLNSGAVLVTWKAARGSAIDFVVGFPTASGGVKWGRVGVIKGASTNTTPAIAEAGDAGTPTGQVYVLWRKSGSAGSIEFATTDDPLPLLPKWGPPRTLPRTVRTGAAPSAQALGKNSTSPLLVVFRAVRSSALFYVTLARDGKTTSPLMVPRIRSLTGAAMSPGVLFAQSPDPGNVFYQPFVRPCAGC